MAGLYRVGAAVLLALTLVMLWTPAHASFPSTPAGLEYSWPTGGGVANYNWLTTASAACSDGVGKPHFGQTIAASAAYPTAPWRCSVDYVGGGAAIVNLSTNSVAESCPANSTLSGGQCTCTAPYLQNVANDGCYMESADDVACAALASGLNYVGAPMVHYGSAGLTACFGGYVIAGSGAASGGGQTELYGPFKCSGATASTCSVVPKPSTITADCAAGSYPGTVNGVQVCVPPSESVEAPKSTTTAPPAGGGSAPEIPGAPAGTTSEEKQTVCDGPNCTTTTTYRDSGGVSTGTKTETVPKSSYCAENPKAPGCESLEASTFGGNCAAGFTFKGDAIQGALAKEVYKQNCIINDTNDESALYASEKAKPQGDLTGDLPGNETITVDSGAFDSSDAIGGAACITDKTVVVWGKTVVLPFSKVCPAFDYLRYILLTVAWLTAAGIVVGRKT